MAAGAPPVRPVYRFFATGLGASMWFWIFYRAKKDGIAPAHTPLLLLLVLTLSSNPAQHHPSTVTTAVVRC
ncbi:hypothetical protein VTJ49DRAFT_5101 [Mycothermus thermophilus]|uniref:Uncharacterized protein n=1 Tax=Humicola insolens TaxID=85995 RepID=A0ABR3VL42_HUMIN